LEDQVIKSGLKDFCDDCYNGDVSLDEYVHFILNVRFLRENKFPQYETIDWEKINEGINTVKNKLLEAKELDDSEYTISSWISVDKRKYFSSDELKAYDSIDLFCEEGQYYFERNKRQYLEILSSGDIKDIVFMKNKSFDRFDKDMAIESFGYYEKLIQIERNSFPQYFLSIFGNLEREKNFNKSETIKGLEWLINNFDRLKQKYKKEDKIVATISLNRFIEELNILLEKYLNVKVDKK